MSKKLSAISLFSALYLFLTACAFANDLAKNGGESVLSPVTQKELAPFDQASSAKTNELSGQQASEQPPAQSTEPAPAKMSEAPAVPVKSSQIPKAPAAPKSPKADDKKSAQTEGVRAGDIYVSCKDYFDNKFNTKENISKRATCNGYFFGVGSTLLTLASYGINTNICVPADITTHQVIQVFLDWGKANTDNLSIQAADATLKALGARFPCQ
jgi:hypothetical protein